MKRIAIVGGCRTPFVRAGSAFKNLSSMDLAVSTVQGLCKRLSLDEGRIDEVVYGTVLLDPRYPNFAREVVLRAGLRPTIRAHAVSNNCITGLVAAAFVGDGIRSGRISSGLAGGVESMSLPSLTVNRKAERFFIDLSRARSFGQKLALLARFRPGFLLPQAPSPKEPTTGLTMGQHCEITTKEFAIARALQDDIAYRSHQNAARAAKEGFLQPDILPLEGLTVDNLIRPDTTKEKLAGLSPVFDRSGKGTLTAGNSSSLTDGASVVSLMTPERAAEERRTPLGFIEDYEFAAIAPGDGLLMAPCFALPRLLERRGLSVKDIDIFEIHEAFAAQVAANLHVWSQGWKKYPELKPIGEIPVEKINPNGGSLALGHPFAATGGRLIMSAARGLQKSGGKYAVISVCAAGGMAGAMLISRE